MPNTDKDEPRRDIVLTDNELPMLRKSITDIADPTRDKARSDTELPTLQLSQMDNDDPNRAIPNKDNELPIRAHVRNASALPTVTISRTAKEEPYR
jgi:hypothetical protein